MDSSAPVALITGGGRGIGRAIAWELAQLGMNLVIIDKVFPEDFPAFVEQVSILGRSVLSREADVTSVEAVDAMVDGLAAECGHLDVLVNNAGITRDKLLMRMTEQDWDLVLAVNLKGAFVMTRAVTRHMMRQRHGKIINITSVVGVMGNAGQANYAASKAGMIGFSKSVAKELAGRNITVNCVAPGFVETEMTHVLTEEQKAVFLSVIPLKRACSPAEVAGVVGFLASPKSDYITGQVLCVDGGMIM